MTPSYYVRRVPGKPPEVMIEIAPNKFLSAETAVELGYISQDMADSLPEEPKKGQIKC
jgi:hypothetical protein